MAVSNYFTTGADILHDRIWSRVREERGEQKIPNEPIFVGQLQVKTSP
jgi:hypothetical protein